MKYFSNWIKEYNKFTKGDRHSIIILASLILLTLIAILLIPLIIPESEFDYSQYFEPISALEKHAEPGTPEGSLFYFNPNTISARELDSLALPVNIRRNIISYRKAGGVFKNADDVRKIYRMNDSIFAAISAYIKLDNSPAFPSVTESKGTTGFIFNEGFFDPNNAGADELTAFGFSPFQARNIVAYRNKGGTFKIPADTLKIYGVDSALFNRIKDNIRIETAPAKQQFSETEQLFIDLNEADSSDLVELNGIGPAFAGRILKYREKLGGFYSPKQVLEIYNFPTEAFAKIEGSIYADTLKIKKLRINFADFKELIRHPYFDKQKVNQMLQYREKHGPFNDLRDVKKAGIFNEGEFNRVEPYLTCR